MHVKKGILKRKKLLVLFGNVLSKQDVPHTGEAEHGGVLEGNRRLHGRDQPQGRGRQGKVSNRKGISKKTSFLQVVGSGGGVLAGGLTLAGGVMTVMTAGAALPVLVAVRIFLDIKI